MAQAAQFVYVYGVGAAGEASALSVRGVEDGEIRTVEHAGLVALVSPVSGGPLTAAREVRSHWRVLEEASAAATLLPVRFGTVLEGEQAVRERLLGPNAERLEQLLRELAGHVQLAVRAEYDEKLLMRDVVRGSPAVGELRERIRTLPDEAGYYERIRLGELVAGEVARRRSEDTGIAIELLEPVVAALKEEELRHPNSAFNLALLVRRDAQEVVGREVARLGERLGDRVALRFVGPLPPYSFADIELDAEAAAWA